MRKKIYSKYLSNNSEIKFKQILKNQKNNVNTDLYNFVNDDTA